MDEKAEELTAIIREIRERVRSRHPVGGATSTVPLADLLPLLHARDGAEGKVAAIGTVNPRAGGLLNSIVQWVKRAVARALDWHIREQVEFNRGVMNCVQSTIEALNDTNRAIAALAGQIQRVESESQVRVKLVEEEARELKDVRKHWSEWRLEWERKIAATEIHFFRSLSDLQAAWQHRVTLMDETHRQHMKALHGDFEGALDRATADIQKRLWVDLERIRTEYETIIHAELRLLRQKASLLRAGSEVVSKPADTIDWLKFGEKFRGSEDYVKRHLELYVERFAGCSDVLDIGCGRGELLEVLREANISAHGIDLNDDCIAMCVTKDLQVDKADLFQYLSDAPDSSIGGVVCLQVVEHLPPARLPEFVALVHAKLKLGGLFAIETPNPECLAIFARHFYLDPTHAKPLPPALTAFYLEEAGFGRLETVRLEPAIDSMPSLASLPDDFRADFFGSLDYAVFGRKL